MRWRATMMALITGGILTACFDAPTLRLGHGALGDAATMAARDASIVRAAEQPKPVSWSDLLPDDAGYDAEPEWDEPPMPASPDPAALEDLMESWRQALEGSAVVVGSDALPDALPTDLQAEPGTAVEETGAAVAGASDVAADEELVDPVWVDEELTRLHEHVLELEAQVQQQRADLDTMALAMAVQARRVTILDAAVSQLALVCGR